MHVFHITAFARATGKSSKNHLAYASGASRMTARFRKALCSHSQASKWSLRALQEASGGTAGRFWNDLGCSWTLLGALGALLGGFEVGFGRVWDGSGEGLGWVFAAGQLEFKFESSSI